MQHIANDCNEQNLLAGLSVLVLVMGVSSNTLYHAAEAKGMSSCWLNPDGTVKAQYQLYLKSSQQGVKYPDYVGKAFCAKQTK